MAESGGGGAGGTGGFGGSGGEVPNFGQNTIVGPVAAFFLGSPGSSGPTGVAGQGGSGGNGGMAQGGGIYSVQNSSTITLALTNSTIGANLAESDPEGLAGSNGSTTTGVLVFTGAGGEVPVFGVAFANAANGLAGSGNAGGFYNAGASVVLVNDTIAEDNSFEQTNGATPNAVGTLIPGVVTLDSFVPEVFSASSGTGSFSLLNTIVAGLNFSGAEGSYSFGDMVGSFTSLGHNLITSVDTGVEIGLGGAGSTDLIGTPTNPISQNFAEVAGMPGYFPIGGSPARGGGSTVVLQAPTR